MKKKYSTPVPFEVVQKNIKNGDKWVRMDWTDNNKYLILADERYCTPRLLLVYIDTDSYVIFNSSANDYKYLWKKILA
jgi:hypothetical protein